MQDQVPAGGTEPTPIRQINAAGRWFFRIAEWVLIVSAFQFVAEKVGNTLIGAILELLAGLGGFFISAAIAWPAVEYVGSQLEKHAPKLPIVVQMGLFVVFVGLMSGGTWAVAEFVKAIISPLVAFGSG